MAVSRRCGGDHVVQRVAHERVAQEHGVDLDRIVAPLVTLGFGERVARRRARVAVESLARGSADEACSGAAWTEGQIVREALRSVG